MNPDLFFIIFLATILVTRVALYFKPVPSPTIHEFRLHHYMYGTVLLIIGILITNLWCLAVGLGLFIDELPFLLIGGKTHADNYSVKSLVGVTVLVIVVFFLRGYIIKTLL